MHVKISFSKDRSSIWVLKQNFVLQTISEYPFPIFQYFPKLSAIKIWIFHFDFLKMEDTHGKTRNRNVDLIGDAEYD